MNTLPDDDTPEKPRNDRGDKENAPTPSEIFDAVYNWLLHWWDAPHEKSKPADWVLVVLTIGIAIAAFRSISVFQGQLSEAQRATNLASESFRVDERAWLGIKMQNVSIHATSQGDGRINIDHIIIPIRNSGKTPALNVDGFYVITTRKWNEEIPEYDSVMSNQGWTTEESDQLSSPLANLGMNLRYAVPRPGSTTITYGMGIVHDYVLAPSVEHSFDLGGQNFHRTSPKDGTTPYIYILGAFNYDDIFKLKRRTTKFCLLNDGGEEFRFCIKGQEMN